VGEPGRVPAPVRLDHLDVVAAREPAVHDHRVARRHRRRERVHDEQDPQERLDGTSGPADVTCVGRHGVRAAIAADVTGR
jgi:hypothetical protein